MLCLIHVSSPAHLPEVYCSMLSRGIENDDRQILSQLLACFHGLRKLYRFLGTQNWQLWAKIFFRFSLPSSTKVDVEIDFAQCATEEMQEGCHNRGGTICLLCLPVHTLKLFTERRTHLFHKRRCTPTTIVKVLHAEAAHVFNKGLDLLVPLDGFIVGVVNI